MPGPDDMILNLPTPALTTKLPGVEVPKYDKDGNLVQPKDEQSGKAKTSGSVGAQAGSIYADGTTLTTNNATASAQIDFSNGHIYQDRY